MVPVPKLALRLYLECAEAVNDCDLEPVAYEFFTLLITCLITCS
ncbi:putative vacuolar protein sorting-associated protein [Helianthus anomalus]